MTDDEYRDLLQKAHDMEGHWPLNLAVLVERHTLERAAKICDRHWRSQLSADEIRALIQDAAPTASKEDQK